MAVAVGVIVAVGMVMAAAVFMAMIVVAAVAAVMAVGGGLAIVIAVMQDSYSRGCGWAHISQNIAPMIGNMKEGKGTMGNSPE